MIFQKFARGANHFNYYLYYVPVTSKLIILKLISLFLLQNIKNKYQKIFSRNVLNCKALNFPVKII